MAMWPFVPTAECFITSTPLLAKNDAGSPRYQSRGRAERLAQRERFLRICRVHADMAERKAEDDGARRLAALGDSLEAARRDIARRAEPAAADCLHERRFDIIRKIFVVDTAQGRNLTPSNTSASEPASSCRRTPPRGKT